MHRDWVDLANLGVLTATLIALFWFAIDTYRMKREMLRQGSASRRPFFEIISEDRTPLDPVTLCNVGQGIALVTKWTWLDPDQEERRWNLGAIAVGMKVPILGGENDRFLLNMSQLGKHPVRIDYEDTAGKRYWSVIRFEHGCSRIDTGVDLALLPGRRFD
jgi:hypothetical protein